MSDTRNDSARVDQLTSDKTLKALKNLYWQFENAADNDGYIDTVRIRGPRAVGDDYLLVAKRTNGDGEPQVSFVSGTTLADVITAVGNKSRNDTLKWHKDKYANGS